MIRFNISQTKKLFFDRRAVMSAESKATTRVLSRFGSFVRRTARGLLRRKSTKTNPVSKPGEPPRQHSGRLRKFLYFAYEPTRRSVVIGPAKLGASISPDALEVLEHGGRTSRRLKVIAPQGRDGVAATIIGNRSPVGGVSLGGRFFPGGRFIPQAILEKTRGVRFVVSSDAPSVSATYEPRPFMGPAYAKEAPKLPGMWKNSVRK